MRSSVWAGFNLRCLLKMDRRQQEARRVSQERREEVCTGDRNVETVALRTVLRARRSPAGVGRASRALSQGWGEMRLQRRRREERSQWSKEIKRK